MNQFKPEQPVTTYKEFRDAILNEIARCVNMPANKARCDSSGYNYASGRLDHGTYYEALDVDRNQCEIDVIDRVFEWWFDEASLIPNYLPAFPPVESGLPHTWYWSGHKHADPSKEANAAKTLHGLGLLTDEAYLLREGIDPEQHHRQLVTQYKRRAELAKLQLAAGLPMPAEGREPSGTTRRRRPATAAN
jgi:capsid protein